MNKAYSRINWENYPSTGTPLNETNLNHMDLAVDTIDDRVITLDTTKADESDLLTCVASISFNSTTGIMTITLKNGTQGTIDTGLSKLAINFDYDDDPTSPHYQQIILEMKDGTYKYIDLSALITQYEFTNSSTIAWTIGNDGTVSASVVDGSITADKLQPNYLADIILQVGYAQTAATNANADSLEAEGWAVGEQGGVPVTSGSPYFENNAKWYSDHAGGQSFFALNDVDGTGVQNGDVFAYDSVSQKLKPTSMTAIVQIPVPKTKTYTYNGTTQTFEWDSIDTRNIVLSGDTHTDAGTYTVTATLKSANDYWVDMTTAPKTFSWSIGKANQDFTLSKSTASIIYPATTDTVNVTDGVGDGTFSVSSSNTGIATASKSGNTITITGVSTGSATITVTKAATSNYNAKSKTISVDVSTVQAITFTIKSAINDTITIDGPLHTGAGAITATTDASGNGTVTMTIPSTGGNYTFTSSVAKAMDLSGNAYVQTVNISASTASVSLIPSNALFWWGVLNNGQSLTFNSFYMGGTVIFPVSQRASINGNAIKYDGSNEHDLSEWALFNNKINFSQISAVKTYCQTGTRPNPNEGSFAIMYTDDSQATSGTSIGYVRTGTSINADATAITGEHYLAIRTYYYSSPTYDYAIWVE